jgi:hypothetical protein
MFKWFIKISAFCLLSQVVFSHNLTVLRGHTSAPIQPTADTSDTVEYHEPSVFAALPSFDQSVRTAVKTSDARAEIIRQYLRRYNSPLEPEADLIVELSDQHNFDYRWMVAIAQQESNLCKRIPVDSYNCWGWGIYPDPKNPEVLKVTRFASYADALTRIAPQFTRIFLKGNHSKDPYEVMKTYTPPSEGSWARGVNQFFGDLE